MTRNLLMMQIGNWMMEILHWTICGRSSDSDLEENAPTDLEMRIASFSAVPLPSWCFYAPPDGNWLATKFEKLIDWWLAIVEDDELKFPLIMDERWAFKYLAGTSTRIPFFSHIRTNGSRINLTNGPIRSWGSETSNTTNKRDTRTPHVFDERVFKFYGWPLVSCENRFSRSTTIYAGARGMGVAVLTRGQFGSRWVDLTFPDPFPFIFFPAVWFWRELAKGS